MRRVSDEATETWKRSKWEFTYKGIRNWLSLPVFYEKMEFTIPLWLCKVCKSLGLLLAAICLFVITAIAYPLYVLWVLFFYYPSMIIRTKHQIKQEEK